METSEEYAAALARTGRVTLCDGAPPDPVTRQNYCPAFRVLPGGRIGISCNADLDVSAELVFEGHEIQQVIDAFNAGTVPQHLRDAIDADVARQG